MPLPIRPIAGLGAALVVASAAAWAAPASKATTPRPARPRATAHAPAAPARKAAPAASAAGAADTTVLARLPFAVITRQDFLRSWARLDPAYRPAGTDAKAKRAFLDQLVQKDLLAHAAVTDTFAMSPLESAKYETERRDILRQAVFQRYVSDSAVVVPADMDSVRSRLAPGQAETLGPARIQAAAAQFAQRRRAGEIDARIKDEVAPAWDDSVAALLVHAYSTLDHKLPDASQPFSLKLPVRQPTLSPADSGRVLAKTSLGPMTAAGFARRFLDFDPFKTPLPDSIQDVKNLGSLLLGQAWLDRATLDPRIAGDPGVRAAIAERYENIALDHYYAKHVQGQVDTSDATLRARYAKTPDAYARPARFVITRLTFANQAAADSAQQALAKGASWDSICAHAFAAADGRRADCANEMQLPDPYPDTIFAAVLNGLAPGESSVLPMPAGQDGGERRLLLRLVRHDARTFQSFEDARGFVVRDVAQDQAEKILDALIARLKAATPVTVNERALARTDLASWARMIARAQAASPGGATPPPSDR